MIEQNKNYRACLRRCGRIITMRRGILGAMLVALFTLLPTPVFSADFAVDFVPNEERQVTWYGSTSNCIGDPRSPACALDTMMACMLRRDAALCRSIGMEEFCEHSTWSGARYKIRRVDVRSRMPGKEAVEIWFYEKLCFSSEESCVAKDDFVNSSGSEFLFRSEDRWLFQGESDLSERLCWFKREFGH
jgi:hypothetical protein